MKRFLALLLCLLFLGGCTFAGPGDTSADNPVSPDTEFCIHFIDVGQADCALIECGGAYMLIDGGNREDSSLVVSYLDRLGVRTLDAVVCSHAHEDHVGGLPGVLAVFETKTVYAPTRTYASDVFDKFLYYTDQQGLEVTIPTPGDVIQLGEATVTVLGPVKSYAETNDTSLVLMVEFGRTRFLFTGDMETAAENDMLDHWGEDFDWRADVLKVGHHGSDTSTGYRFLNAVMPTIAVISVGEGNSYGHPCEVPLSRLHDAGAAVYRTDHLGHIIIRSDGTALECQWENSAAQVPTGPQENVSTTFIGNKNSKKLHVPGCANLPKPENQVIFYSYSEAVAAGYTPCASCLG